MRFKFIENNEDKSPVEKRCKCMKVKLRGFTKIADEEKLSQIYEAVQFLKNITFIALNKLNARLTW
jgi:hypothetical protein